MTIPWSVFILEILALEKLFESDSTQETVDMVVNNMNNVCALMEFISQLGGVSRKS